MEKRSGNNAIILVISVITIYSTVTGVTTYPPKRATQSNTYQGSTADRAIDGSTSTCSVAENNNGFGWWQVDLGGTFTVYSVTLMTNSYDGSDPQYLENFIISVGATNSTVVDESKSCSHFNNGSHVSPGIFLTLLCTPKPLGGRYVTIQRRGGYRQDAISFCEVKMLYSYAGNINLYNLTANQTGGSMDHGPNLAKDLDLNTCSQPVNPSGNAMWYIDLQHTYVLTNVTVFNQDSSMNFNTQTDQLSFFRVRVGKTSSLNSQTECCYFNYVVKWGENATCSCSPSSRAVGNFVSIERDNGNNKGAVVLCEVLIYGYMDSGASSSTSYSFLSSSSSSSSSSTTTLSSTKISSISIAVLSGTIGRLSNSSATTSTTSFNSSDTGNVTVSGPSADNQSYTGSNKNVIIICVVVIIGGLLLIGAGIAIIYLFLRGRICKEKGNKSVLILPVRRQSSNPYSNVTLGDENLNRPIRETDLIAYVENKQAFPNSFKTEFKKLPDDEASDAIIARKSENKSKNRFANVVPYDHTLVPLEIEDYDDPDANYINANYISGYKNIDKMYIATQGPKPNTLDDFWRMIYQQKVNLIVMITSLTESGKKKCEQYWPENLLSTKTYHKISVTLTAEETYAHHAYREVTIRDERKEDNMPRTVRQMHFLSWSDKSRPDQYLPLLSFRKKVRNLQRTSTGPVVVHCSAGIGRTGTYIAFDYLLEQLKEEHEISIFSCVEALRYQRMSMVQTTEQYMFLHEAIVDGLQSGDTDIACATFVRDYAELAQSCPDGSLSKLEQQFTLLKKLKHLNSERYSSGNERINISKNRDKDIIPYDDGRPYLETTYYNGGDYINATYADCYRSKDAFILTQLPPSDTIVDFWRLIWDHKLKTIVLLDELEPTDENCPKYWSEEKTAIEAYGPFEVEVMQMKEISSAILMREFMLTNTKEKRHDPMTVRQFQVRGWSKDALVPSSASLLLELINMLMDNATKEKVVIQCTDGASRSGLLAAAMYVVDMMMVEQVVDVFLACRFIAVNRPQIISSMKQYTFLHDLASSCLMQYDEYANCKPLTICKSGRTTSLLPVYANFSSEVKPNMRESKL